MRHVSEGDSDGKMGDIDFSKYLITYFMCPNDPNTGWKVAHGHDD